MRWKLIISVIVVVVVMFAAIISYLSGAGHLSVPSGAVDKDPISGNGTVVYQGVEGGFYGIVTDDGKHYDPMNLSPEYRIVGLKIYFEAKKLDILTYRMWGTPISITKIRKIG